MDLPIIEGFISKAVAHVGTGPATGLTFRYLESDQIGINFNRIFKKPLLFDQIK
ncbi:MAG: hypothetical protein AAF789_11170 [Bacteroidota bacterium]